MQNQKNPRQRSGWSTTWNRALQLVALCDRDPGRFTRQYFAERWRVTPRSVSHTITILRETAGVRLEAVPGAGYRVADPGILNLRRLGGRR